ncbi:MAG: helix-turn-helix domain-containing protein [Bacillota bacterium]
MLNETLVHSFLTKQLSILSYQIWLYQPLHHEWELIAVGGLYTKLSSKSRYEAPPSSLTDQSVLTFTFPQGYQALVVHPDSNSTVNQENIDLLFHLLYPLYTSAIMNSKNLELEKLIEGTQNITSLLDLDELLAKILDNVAVVIPGANTSAFWIYDPALDRLVCKAYRGWKSEITLVKYKIGESVTGKTYRDGKARIYHSFRKANEAMRGTSKKNLELITAAFHDGRVKAAVIVPVKFHNEIRGVLSIHQDEQARKLTDWDLKLLEGLTAQIAIAIENARLFTEITRKNQVLVTRNEVHSTLTKLSLQNKGVGSITKELNRMIKSSVVFVDLLAEEFYPKREKRYFTFDELSKILSERNQPVYIDLSEGEDKSFYIYPIFVGNACSACLVVTGDLPLKQLDHMILERGGVFLALELAKRNSVTEVFYKKTHDYYYDLLSNEDPSFLNKQGLDFGIELDKHLFTVIIEFSKFHDLQVLESKVHHFVWTIKQKLSNARKLLFGNHNKVILLFSIDDSSNKPIIIDQLESIIKAWQESERIHLFAGVGRIYKGIHSINKTHNEATKALSYLLSCETPGVIDYAEIGVNRLFINHSQDELSQFVEEIFSPLNAPKLQNVELEKTLSIYIRSNRSATKTAEKLHIHINTLYQRIKKIEEILDVSLNDSEAMLKIQLACHLRETYV